MNTIRLMQRDVPKISKYSRQRETILNILRSARHHPTAEWIYQEARKKSPTISKGTVYRNLNWLRDAGKIREVNVERNIRQYDGDVRLHDHILCNHCGRIDDVPHGAPRVVVKEVESLTGYRIFQSRAEYWGICPACLEKDRQIEYV